MTQNLGANISLPALVPDSNWDKLRGTVCLVGLGAGLGGGGGGGGLGWRWRVVEGPSQGS